MDAMWIGKKLSEEIRTFVHVSLGLSGKKIETEMARRAILFAVRIKPEEFKNAWKEGLLDL